MKWNMNHRDRPSLLRDGSGPTTTFIEAIDHVERVASNFTYVGDLTPHIGLKLPINALKPIKARVFVGHGRTHPSLSVTHLPPELFDAEVFQLGQSLSQLVDRVSYLLDAVSKSRSLSLGTLFGAGDLAQVL